MQKIMITLLALLTINTVNAQTKKATSSDESMVFHKGVKVANIGIALGSTLGIPVGLGFEYGVTDKIGIGAALSYAQRSYKLVGTDKYKISSLLIGARGNYHFYMKDKIDVYGGVTLGFNVASVKYPSTYPAILQTAKAGGVIWAGVVGGRYYFKPTLAVYAEAGYGLGFLTVGIAKKF